MSHFKKHKSGLVKCSHTTEITKLGKGLGGGGVLGLDGGMPLKPQNPFLV